MFARRIIDVRGEESRSAPLPYLIASPSKLVRSVFAVNLKLFADLSEFAVDATGSRARCQTSFMDRSKLPSWIEICLALIDYIRRANAALCEN
jgi:hypothetical protein